jgi:LuxR family maltose regulon positive regulatory protein
VVHEVRRDAAKPIRRPVDFMLEAKLRPPPARPEWVTRSRLVDELEKASQRPVTLIAAPAGYGKTTAVTQWLASTSGPATTAWVSLDTADNDPVRLWTHIATALDRAGCVIARDIAGFVAAGSHDMLNAVLPKIITGMAELASGVTLLIDDFHIVRSTACHAQIDFLIKHLPDQAHVVLITRADPTLRLGRLRAAGQLSEIRADDLAFDVAEAVSLLASDGVRLSTESMS